jgi:hypothetical protein
MTAIITPEQRLGEPRSARILLLGPNGVGKTTQAGRLDPTQTLVIDVENGLLAIAGVPVAHARPETHLEICDLIVRIVGPNKSFAPHEIFSTAHFERCGGFLPDHSRYRTIVVDTVTAWSRLSFRHASQQPEAISDRGKLDLRGVYGAHARGLILPLHHLQSARGLNVILIGALETVTDDYGRVEHKLQAEGQRVPREILGIVDVVVTMNWIDFGDDKPIRGFVCTSPNPWGYPAKDRSGKLDQLEPPDLGKLIAKILPPPANHVGGGEGEASQSSIVPFTKQQQEEKLT